jgi:hypothetical protein
MLLTSEFVYCIISHTFCGIQHTDDSSGSSSSSLSSSSSSSSVSATKVLSDSRVARLTERVRGYRSGMIPAVTAYHRALNALFVYNTTAHVSANEPSYSDYIQRKKQCEKDMKKWSTRMAQLIEKHSTDVAILASAGITVLPNIPMIEYDQAVNPADSAAWLKACDDFGGSGNTASAAANLTSSALSSSLTKYRASSIDADKMIESDKSEDERILVSDDDNKSDDDRYNDGPKSLSISSSSVSHRRRDNDDHSDVRISSSRNRQHERRGGDNTNNNDNTKTSSARPCMLTIDQLTALYVQYAGEDSQVSVDGFLTKREAMIDALFIMTGKKDINELWRRSDTHVSANARISKKRSKHSARDSDDSEGERRSSKRSSHSSSSMRIDSDSDYSEDDSTNDALGRPLMVPDVLAPHVAPNLQKTIKKLRKGTEYIHISKLIRHRNTIDTSQDDGPRVMKFSGNGTLIAAVSELQEKSKRSINSPLMYIETMMTSFMMALALNAMDATTIEAKNASIVSLYNHMIYVVYAINKLHACAHQPSQLNQIILFCEEQRKLSMDNKTNIANIDIGLVARMQAGSYTMFDQGSSASGSMASSSTYAQMSNSSEICKKFQSRTCTYKPCKFAHVCMNGSCNRASHPLMSCPFKTSSSSKTDSASGSGAAAAPSSANGKIPRRK